MQETKNNKVTNISQLKSIIYETLTPHITKDYVYLDLPYHPNIGDSLIALGTRTFLRSQKYQCLYSSSLNTYEEKYIPDNALIVLQGGGNFGDLWEDFQLFRDKIIETFSDYDILIMPQSVHYNDTTKLERDKKIFSKAKHLTMCTRDMQSYLFLKEHFSCENILLVPDMAFCLSFPSIYNVAKDNTLFVKRTDKEYTGEARYDLVPPHSDIHDWPTMETKTLPYRLYIEVEKINRGIAKYISHSLANKIYNFCWKRILIPYNVKMGVKFLNSYSEIYTTRLHAAILGTILSKQVFIFDNSYKKNSALYNTWLKDFPNVQLL